MYIITDEMKSTADYAIKAAKERFKQDLDYSEQSIARLENILGQIYWGFSNRTKEESEDGVILNTAMIWGSYLGEFMRLKMGGMWILKGSDPLISIKNIEFSPVSLVYHKITDHPEYSLENYLNESKRVINTSVITPQQSRYRAENVSQPEKPVPTIPAKKPVTIDKRLMLILAGIVGILFVTLAIIIGYRLIKAGGEPSVGVIASATSSNTNIPSKTALVAASPFYTMTPYPTATLLPTYTPEPTQTTIPSYTASLTFAQTVTSTPTDTPAPTVIPPTRRPTFTPTTAPTHVPATEVPPPTATQPPPVVIQSCEVNPSTIAAGISVPLTFTVHFSAPGYGFEALNPPNNPGQNGCSGSDGDGDGVASCDGSSGLLPSSTKIDVTIRSSVGNCTVSYRSQ